MRRLRVFFAIILFCGLFPLWRLMDYQILIIPSSLLFTVSMCMILTVCVIIPVHLSFPKIRKIFFLPAIIIGGILLWSGSPLSGMATYHFELRHCGAATFSGALYHARGLLPSAHQDDIEARNQMCWIRKMITRAPESISDVNELQNYLDLIRKKLLSPDHKYKVALPLIAFLHGRLSTSLSGTALESIEIGKLFLDSLQFWRTQYTEEISSRIYPWWNWPHSSYIKWEYGLIENNWESLVESIQIE